MTKFKFQFSVLLIFIISTVNAQWVSLNDEIKQNAPKVIVTEDTKANTTIKINLPGFAITETIIDGIVYHELDLNTDSNTNIIGAPSLPLIPSLIAIPDEASVSYEIIETGEVTTYENINILPGRKSWIEGMEETKYVKNIDLFTTNEMFPKEVVKTDKPAIFRDYRIVRMAVSPMQYNPVTKQLKVTSSFKIRLNYEEDGNAINPRKTSRKAISPSYDKLYKSTLLNYGLNQKSTMDTYAANDLMLCIVPDALYNDFLPYAEWKKRTGIDIHVTRFSEIGATATNPITIKDHITDAYHNWSTPPSYVLLVGDDGVFPVKTYNSEMDSYSGAYENYFVEIDGDDFLPEMFIGRFTNQGNYRLKVMTNKFEKYIREPYVEETAWYKKGLFSSNSAYQSQVNTIAWTREIVLDHANFTSVDPMMFNGTFDDEGNWNGVCNYSVDDVLAGLNEGRSVVNYRGEGWFSGWTDSCISFGNDDLSNLNPSRKHFFFTNIGCGVAMFDAGECFGERLVEQGSISNPKGAIAFIGPTTNSHTTYNNKMDKGIYKGMYQEGLDTPGEGLTRGCIYQYAVFGSDDYWVEYHHRVFCVLGDPSIKIWKEVPLAVNVSHVTSLPIGNSTTTIAVNYEGSGNYSEDAIVTLTNDNGLFITGTTDASGNVTFTIDLDTLSDINVTVTGGDVITYEGVISMSTAGVTDVTNDITNFSTSPNPFTTSAKIKYTLLEANNTTIKIFNIRGQIVRNLDKSLQSAGNHTIEWNGLNDTGNKLDNGVYFCQLISGNSVNTIKLLMN